MPPTNAYGAPYWVRLERNGDELRGFRSTDGSHWELIRTTQIAMNNTVQVGLVVGSHNANKQARAVFSHVDIQPPPQVSVCPPVSFPTFLPFGNG